MSDLAACSNLEDPAEPAQIFRFPLPQSLLPAAQAKPAVMSEKAGQCRNSAGLCDSFGLVKNHSFEVAAAPTATPLTLASAYAVSKDGPNYLLLASQFRMQTCSCQYASSIWVTVRSLVRRRTSQTAVHPKPLGQLEATLSETVMTAERDLHFPLLKTSLPISLEWPQTFSMPLSRQCPCSLPSKCPWRPTRQQGSQMWYFEASASRGRLGHEDESWVHSAMAS